MPRHVRAAVLTVGLLGPPTLAHAQLNESPITPGFWSFPSQKTKTAKDVIATCRDHFEIRFADGHFIGLRMRRSERGLVQREVEDVGSCVFNRETQIESVFRENHHSDGSISGWNVEKQIFARRRPQIDDEGDTRDDH